MLDKVCCSDQIYVKCLCSSVIRNDIACHTLRDISVIAHLSRSGCSNLCSIGRIQMISNTELPVAIEGNCSCNCPRVAIAGDSLADVSIKSRGSNFIRVGGVEMIIRGWTRPPVAVERNSSAHLSRVNKTRYAF